mmetsp:Transcript_25571/g.37775  ORF Transcript_25571/g.37775 Transcript_25571/m.37775 type:complete len:153 (-) Transcript_25571:233-691(-)
MSSDSQNSEIEEGLWVRVKIVALTKFREEAQAFSVNRSELTSSTDQLTIWIPGGNLFEDDSNIWRVKGHAFLHALVEGVARQAYNQKLLPPLSDFNDQLRIDFSRGITVRTATSSGIIGNFHMIPPDGELDILDARQITIGSVVGKTLPTMW